MVHVSQQQILKLIKDETFRSDQISRYQRLYRLEDMIAGELTDALSSDWLKS